MSGAWRWREGRHGAQGLVLVVLSSGSNISGTIYKVDCVDDKDPEHSPPFPSRKCFYF